MYKNIQESNIRSRIFTSQFQKGDILQRVRGKFLENFQKNNKNGNSRECPFLERSSRKEKRIKRKSIENIYNKISRKFPFVERNHRHRGKREKQKKSREEGSRGGKKRIEKKNGQSNYVKFRDTRIRAAATERSFEVVLSLYNCTCPRQSAIAHRNDY